MTVITMMRCFLRPWVSSTHTSTRNGFGRRSLRGCGCMHTRKTRRPARNGRFRAHRLGGPTDSTDVGWTRAKSLSLSLSRSFSWFRHYIIRSFTHNIVVANMSLMSEIRGPYRNRPCVMRFSRFRFDVSVHPRTIADSPPNRKSPIRFC